MIQISPVTPEIVRVTTAPFWTRWQKLAYPTKYLGKYWSELHELFSFGGHMHGDY